MSIDNVVRDFKKLYDIDLDRKEVQRLYVSKYRTGKRIGYIIPKAYVMAYHHTGSELHKKYVSGGID